MKVYITKYALSRGVFDSDHLIGISMYGTKYCHQTEEEAIKHANELRDKKIESLKKQIEKLEKMKFV